MIVTGGGKMGIDKDILKRLNEQNIKVFTINDIIDLGSYDNLRKILERMTKSGILRRLIRGVYEIPKYNKTFNMIAPPSIDEIAKALARNFNWDIYPSGNYALNILGVSTQIPSKYIYISSGPNRKYEYEGNIIVFKHATLKETNSFSYITNIVIQAFKELGKDNITDDIIKLICQKFSSDEINLICEEAKKTTIWIYQNILRLKEVNIHE